MEVTDRPHFRTLGWCHAGLTVIYLGAGGALVGMCGFVLRDYFHEAESAISTAEAVGCGIGFLVGVWALIASPLCLAASVGFFANRWDRIRWLASCWLVPGAPVGTIVGLYGIWALRSQRAAGAG